MELNFFALFCLAYFIQAYPCSNAFQLKSPWVRLSDPTDFHVLNTQQTAKAYMSSTFIIHPCDPIVVICYLIRPCDIHVGVCITYLISHSSSLSYKTVIKGNFRLSV